MAKDNITPELLLNAYAQGYFPMARSERGRSLYWFCPEERAVLPLTGNGFHLSRSLKKAMRNTPHRITFNAAFPLVMRECQQKRYAGRNETWINPQIITLYTELHRMGFAHSVEVWQEEKLAGGLYGVALGCAFFGESMFSHIPNASKFALHTLAERLRDAGFHFIDGQFENPHLTQFGFRLFPQAQYLAMLNDAIHTPALHTPF